MLKLKRIAKTTATEIELPNGITVLFSYSTPVACHIPGRGYYRTDKQWSRTTSKHIGQFLAHHGARNCSTIEQATLDQYLPIR